MSRIEQLIGEIEEYIDSCKFHSLSNTKNSGKQGRTGRTGR